VREVSALYGALCRARRCAGVADPVRGFAVGRRWLWATFWRTNRLCGASRRGAAVLELPLDRPRQRMQGISGERRSLVLRPVWRRGCEPRPGARGRRFHGDAGDMAVLLGRLAGADGWRWHSDPGRNRLAAENLIGSFVTPGDAGGPVGRSDFQQFMGRCREVCLGAFTHQDLPSEAVEELRAGAPAWQTRRSSRSCSRSRPIRLRRSSSRGVVVAARRMDRKRATIEFDLEKIAIQEGQGRSGVGLTYNRTLFRRHDRGAPPRPARAPLVARSWPRPSRGFRISRSCPHRTHQLTIEWNSAEALAAHPYCLHETDRGAGASPSGGDGARVRRRGRSPTQSIKPPREPDGDRLRSLGWGRNLGWGSSWSVRWVSWNTRDFQSRRGLVPLDPSRSGGRLSYIVATPGFRCSCARGRGSKSCRRTSSCVRFGDEEESPRQIQRVGVGRSRSPILSIPRERPAVRGLMVEHRQGRAYLSGPPPCNSVWSRRSDDLPGFISFDILLVSSSFSPALGGAGRSLRGGKRCFSPTHLTADRAVDAICTRCEA